MSDHYGQELLLDLHGCRPEQMTRRRLRKFFLDLCALTKVKAGKRAWWDYFWWPEFLTRDEDPRIFGTSAVQFILTSNITVHALPRMGRVYINLFSCDEFDADSAAELCSAYFGGTIKALHKLRRV